MTDSAEQPLSLVLFSGTEDRLQAAAVMAAGAAALGRQVHIFLQYWALDAFRADRIGQPLPLAPEAGPAGKEAVEQMRAAGQQPWSVTLAQAKEIGEVDIQACSLSMDVLSLSADQLDPLVDGVEGVAAFFVNAGDGQVVFI
jgi:peroxiredoxin family protein